MIVLWKSCTYQLKNWTLGRPSHSCSPPKLVPVRHGRPLQGLSCNRTHVMGRHMQSCPHPYPALHRCSLSCSLCFACSLWCQAISRLQTWAVSSMPPQGLHACTQLDSARSTSCHFGSILHRYSCILMLLNVCLRNSAAPSNGGHQGAYHSHSCAHRGAARLVAQRAFRQLLGQQATLSLCLTTCCIKAVAPVQPVA